MVDLPNMKPPVGKSGPLTCSRTRSRSERVSSLPRSSSAMQALMTSVRLWGGMLEELVDTVLLLLHPLARGGTLEQVESSFRRGHAFEEPSAGVGFGGWLF